MIRKPARTLLAPALLILPSTVLGCGSSKEAKVDNTPAGVCKRVNALRAEKSDDCVAKYETLKVLSPAGYDCVANCAELESEATLDLCIGVCGGVRQEVNDWAEADKLDRDVTARERTQDAAPPPADEEARTDWAKLSLLIAKKDKQFEGTLRGDDGKLVPFVITLTEDFSAPGEADGHFVSNVAGYPKVNVSIAPPTPGTPQERMNELVDSLWSSNQVIKKVANEKGYFVHIELNTGVSLGVAVMSVVDFGDKRLSCEAILDHKAGAVRQAELFAWVDKFCRSARLK